MDEAQQFEAAVRAGLKARKVKQAEAPAPALEQTHAPKQQAIPLWGWVVIVLFGLSVASGHGPSVSACDMSLTQPKGGR